MLRSFSPNGQSGASGASGVVSPVRAFEAPVVPRVLEHAGHVPELVLKVGLVPRAPLPTPLRAPVVSRGVRVRFQSFVRHAVFSCAFRLWFPAGL